MYSEFLVTAAVCEKMLSYLEKSTSKLAAHKKKVTRSRCRDKKAATQDITQRELPTVDHVRWLAAWRSGQRRS